MDEKQGLEHTDEGAKDAQFGTGELQRPAIRKDYGKEAGNALKDLEITRETEAANILTTLASVGEPAKRYEEWTADNVNTGLPRSENDEKEIYGARNKMPTAYWKKLKTIGKVHYLMSLDKLTRLNHFCQVFQTENLCI